MMKRLLFLSILTAATAFGQQYTLKFATLASEGTTWLNVMREFDKAVRSESGGRLGFKIYAGGVQGDEKDVLRKIKLGQLHCAGVTGNGLTTIAPKARILDSPFFFKSYDEVDYILKTYDTEFAQAFRDGGYVNLGWAEVGWIYVFTNARVVTPDDMRHVKMWMWEGDPIAEAAFKALGVHPIPLSITDVLTSLQTRLIDGVYTPPLAAIALQWFTRVKFMLDAPLADAAGAVVISRKKFDELPPDLQEILVRNGRLFMEKLTKMSREDNAKAIQTLKKNGITVVEPPASVLPTYDQIGKEGRRFLVPKLFPQEFLDKVEKSLAEYRSRNHPK
jgi:TRAP-type C4-dicarboxylate transport system substrate-binding protein